MKISIIIPCKNRLHHLVEILPFLERQDYPKLEILVVDYNCPQKTHEQLRPILGVMNQNPQRILKCIKADVGVQEWSLSAARNLGYKYTTGEMLLFLDADAKLTWPDFLTRHVNHCVDGSFICGWGCGSATGCTMLRRSAFEAVKGYNEAIQSWGMEDIDLYSRLENGLAQQRRNWLGGIECIPHGDEWRNYYHGGKDPMQTNEENFHIAQKEFKGI